MEGVPGSVILVIATLTVFLVFITVLKYAIEDGFTQMRLIMTAFFCFIVTTLTLSYWPFFFATLPYTIPAGLAGVLAGYVVGVRTAEERISEKGLRHYKEHFAHIHIEDIASLNWWSVINYYTVLGALGLINLVGLTTVIFNNLKPMTLATSAFGAFLIGSIIPYLIHLWSISPAQNNTKKPPASKKLE